MDVSKKLAQLVTEPESGHESRHYGTVTAVSAIDATHSVVTVLLDGATEPTVCDSHDVKVTVNDRVEVEVRDHRATVKANSTHPVTDDEAAEAAWGHADSAATAAANAWTKAGEAATAASNAQTSANNAADAATNAWNHADSALTAAGVAWDYADTAKGAADQAQADATAAGNAASEAKQAADRSLVQLSIVEDVSGTLNWIAEHGTYEATTDTTVQDGKVYFELVSGDYVPIASPDPEANPQSEGWYVLDITDSQTEYIMAHIAVTSRGLWVLPSGIGSETTPDTGETQADSDARQGDGYKVLLSSRGMTVYDGNGDAVATYGERTIFASDRDWYVGSESAFIFYDASENAIQIGGANVTIGGLTPGQLAGSQIWTATADPTTPNYTFAISNLTGPSGVSPRVGDLVVRSYYRYTISSVSTTTVLTGNRTSIRGGTGAAGPEAVVSISVTAVDFSAGTATLSASLRVNGTLTTPTAYKWTAGTSTQQIGTNAQTLSITDLNATYHCTVTWSGGTQVGSIDLAATSAVKTYAAATFATQGTVSAMQSSIEANAGQIALCATKTEAYQLSQPNLTPYFSMPMTMTTDDYWSNVSYAKFTQQADGWAHFEYNNTGSATSNNYICPRNIDTLTPGGVYTLLIEFRNVSISANGGSFYSQQQTYGQVWGTESTGGFSISNKDIRALSGGAGALYKKLTLLDANSKDLNGTVRGSLPKTQFMSINQQVQAGQSVSYDLRLSLYEGEYTGPYKPYSGVQLYASQAELKVANDAIDARVEKNGVIAAINVSPETGVTIDADRVNISGAAIFTSGRLSEASVNQLSQPNLSPFFSVSKGDVYNASTNPSGYWKRVTNDSQFTTYDMQQTYNGSGGWGHFAGNVTSGSPYVRFEPVMVDLKPSTKYTFMLEWDGTFNNSGNVNFAVYSGTTQNEKDPFELSGSGSFVKNLKVETSPMYVTATTRADVSAATILARQYLQIYGTGSFDGYVRVSLYEGEYSGAYKPYSGDLLYASQTDLRTQAGLVATAQSTANGANSKEQLIYKSAANGTSSMSGTTTWVTDVTAAQATWTAVRPEYSQSYPVLFVATQRQTVGGTVTCTTPAIDKTTTVIDGGNVIANTITATQLNANDINASGSFTVGAFTSAAQSSVLNDKVMMVGWNLLRRSENFVASDIALTRSTVPESGLLKLTPTGSASYAKFRINYLDYVAHGYNTYSFSCDARLADDSTEYTTTNLIVYIGYSDSTAIGSTFANNEHHKYTPAQYLAQNGELTTSWQRLSVTVTLPDAATGGTLTPTAGCQLCVQLAVSGSRKPVLLRYPKLELGGHATDWTPSPSDASNSALVVGGRNLFLDTSDSWSEWVTPTPNANNQSSLFWKTADTSMLAVGSTLTFSCEVEFSGVTASSSGTFRARSQGGAYGDGGSITTVWGVGPCAETFDLSTPPADGVYRYEKTVTLTTDYSDRVSYRCYPRMDYWASGSWRMRRLKLEVGEKATDWTPAPEDQASYVDDLAAQVSQAAEADAKYKAELEKTIRQLLEESRAANDRTQSLRFDTTDGLTIGSKVLDQIETDFNINIKGTGLTFRYKQEPLATASGDGFEAPHLIAVKDLTIGSHWQWQELDGRLVLIYV